MNPTKTQPEFRTPEQIVADEEIAASHEKCIVTDAATGWSVLEATDERRGLAEAGVADPNNAIAAGGLNVPFLWNGKVYRITRACHRGGAAVVETAPADPAFETEVRRRIESVPHHVLTFYQGFGFVCFPEDYARYQG
ncbi:MAG TPA: hypothetical protein VFG68_22030 [Fimbriiglobus sp.]|nr:hypothetical protein [Fimbriiglobus sp.]